MPRLSSLGQRLGAAVPVKPFLLRGQGGVISFTFDDFPRTALTAGGDLLNRRGLAGTYYVAGGLTGAHEQGNPCHTVEDVRAAARDGHEIASHGYAHVPYAGMSSVQIDADLDRNRAFLSDALGEAPSTSFSYPFSARSFKAKARLARRFVTARGNRRGINRRICDLSDLRANPIYAGQMTETMIRTLVENVAREPGWLIFYTHDVSDAPTPWGATPALLDFAIKEAVQSGCRVLPVRNALGAMAFR